MNGYLYVIRTYKKHEYFREQRIQKKEKITNKEQRIVAQNGLICCFGFHEKFCDK